MKQDTQDEIAVLLGSADKDLERAIKKVQYLHCLFAEEGAVIDMNAVANALESYHCCMEGITDLMDQAAIQLIRLAGMKE